jgi:hypothetical protein
MRRVVYFALALVVGCTEPDPETVDWTEEVRALTGDITWEVDFDEAAEANGRTDCTYTRHYEAVEDRSTPWLCVGCDLVYRAQVEMTSGQAECYAQIAEGEPADVEWIGESGSEFRRTYLENYPLTAQGVRTDGFEGFTTLNEVDAETPEGDAFHFTIAGSFADRFERVDPMHGLHPPDDAYSCGWPRAAPSEYDGDYALAVGSLLPDGVFRDACGDVVRLWDLLGSYLVLHVSATDCGPCLQMAETEPELIEGLADQGVSVHSATLLAPSLAEPLVTADETLLRAWTDQFGLVSPVLADRGFGVFVIGAAAGEEFGFPASVVVAPGGEVISLELGFGGWGPFEGAILDHARAGR